MKNLILAIVLVALLVIGKGVLALHESSQSARYDIPADESSAVCKMLLRHAELKAQGEAYYQLDVLEVYGSGAAQGHYVKIDGSKISAVSCRKPV